MKKMSLILSLVLLSSTALADVVEYCKYEVQIDDEEKSVVEIVVEDGMHGGIEVATVHIDSELKIVTDDIKTREYKGADVKNVLSETMLGMISQVHKIDLSQMTSAKAVFLDEEKNQDDANGATVITVLDKDNKIIAKVAQAGWSYGVCQ